MSEQREYDLNVFYEDLGDELADVYTIQPSVYRYTEETDSNDRQYMEAFKLTLEETRAIAPDFPMEDWGSDFFIEMNTFLDMCQSLPHSVKAQLSNLPSIESVPFGGPEYKWINTLF